MDSRLRGNDSWGGERPVFAKATTRRAVGSGNDGQKIAHPTGLVELIGMEHAHASVGMAPGWELH
jgi:hypothetical protein